MRSAANGWLVAGLLLGTMAYAIAEEVTLTTYYPSPRGVYRELVTREHTYLATKDGFNVGIGTGSPSAKLHVNGATRIQGILTVENDMAAFPIRIKGSGTPQNGMVLTAVDSSGNAEWRHLP